MTTLRSRAWRWMPPLVAVTVATVLLAPLVGSTSVQVTRVFDRTTPWADNLDAQIFFVARLPRVLAAAVVGATLAASGVVLQALLRNPLATPFTLGVSAGAALGAMLALAAGLDVGLLGVSSVPLASFAGSLLATGLVYALARSQRRGLSTTVLLLAGVTLNSFFSALILFVQYVADFTQAFRTIRWLMGDLDVGGYASIGAALPFVIVSLGIFLSLGRSLNLLSLGADAAASRGVDVARAERLAFFSASLATGAAVSLAGPIGFIGIVVPHIVRLLVGADHRLVLPASICIGATFLIACDVVSRTALSPLELPVGIVTAMIGGPFFLWQLVRHS